MPEESGEYDREDGRAIAHRAEELRRDEFLKLEAPEESYPVYRWKVGGKEPDGTPTRIGKWTFATKMVRDIVLDALPEGRILNACAGKTKLRKRGCEFVRNDIDEDRDADLHVDVREVHEHVESESFSGAVLDPPFDPGRAAKLYEGWHGQEYCTARDAVGAVVEPGGVVVELGWNSYSLGDKDGWKTEEWYVYPQASFKGDVHLTVDRKLNQQTLVADGGRDEYDPSEDPFACSRCGVYLDDLEQAAGRDYCFDCRGESANVA